MNVIRNRFLFRQIDLTRKWLSSQRQNCHSRSLLHNCIISNTKLKNVRYRSIQVDGTNKSRNSLSQKLVGYWLLTCSGTVFVAVALGGITRLTESGLSMVTWKLLGEKIPSSEALWLEEFERYKQFPEFKFVNKNLTLEDFKRIWWMEYIHRMWGRLIGATFILPAIYFWRKNMLKPVMKIKVLAIGTLIGCQGLMGWYMVKSGLENEFKDPSDVPRVSQYRLSAHLGLAFIIYSGLLYSALDHLVPVQTTISGYFSSRIVQTNLNRLKRFKFLVYSSKGLIFFTAITGAFVSGLDAGLIYNTFPKMSDKWIPDDILFMTPTIRNFTENPATVQLIHRCLAMLTVSVVACIGLKSRQYKLPKGASTAVLAVLGATVLQASLGIFTLLHHVPTHLAALHQSGSLLLLSTIVWLCHQMKYVKHLPK